MERRDESPMSKWFCCQPWPAGQEIARWREEDGARAYAKATRGSAISHDETYSFVRPIGHATSWGSRGKKKRTYSYRLQAPAAVATAAAAGPSSLWPASLTATATVTEAASRETGSGHWHSHRLRRPRLFSCWASSRSRQLRLSDQCGAAALEQGLWWGSRAARSAQRELINAQKDNEYQLFETRFGAHLGQIKAGHASGPKTRFRKEDPNRQADFTATTQPRSARWQVRLQGLVSTRSRGVTRGEQLEDRHSQGRIIYLIQIQVQVIETRSKVAIPCAIAQVISEMGFAV